jgi:hypothetical protein
MSFKPDIESIFYIILKNTVAAAVMPVLKDNLVRFIRNLIRYAYIC